MSELKAMIKQSFELFVRRRWLAEIDKVIKDYEKTNRKLLRQKYVLKELLLEYERRYHEDKGGEQE